VPRGETAVPRMLAPVGFQRIAHPGGQLGSRLFKNRLSLAHWYPMLHNVQSGAVAGSGLPPLEDPDAVGRAEAGEVTRPLLSEADRQCVALHAVPAGGYVVIVAPVQQVDAARGRSAVHPDEQSGSWLAVQRAGEAVAFDGPKALLRHLFSHASFVRGGHHP